MPADQLHGLIPWNFGVHDRFRVVLQEKNLNQGNSDRRKKNIVDLSKAGAPNLDQSLSVNTVFKIEGN